MITSRFDGLDGQNSGYFGWLEVWVAAVTRIARQSTLSGFTAIRTRPQKTDFRLAHIAEAPTESNRSNATIPPRLTIRPSAPEMWQRDACSQYFAAMADGRVSHGGSARGIYGLSGRVEHVVASPENINYGRAGQAGSPFQFTSVAPSSWSL